MDTREVNLSLDFCLRVGELLLSSGAGAADVTATMRTLARHLGLRTAEIDVTFITVAMSYQLEPDELPVTATRQVKSRVIDYDHLTQVDHLVRAVLRDEVELREARSELGRITSTGHSRHRWLITLGMALMAAAVTIQLGGTADVVALSFVAAGAIDRLQLVMHRRRMPIFYQQMSGAGVASILAVGAAALPFEIDVSSAITANIIVLLAGIGFMGALQDALTGFYITASARLVETLLSTAGIIAGVSAGLSIAGLLGISIPTVTPGATSLQGAMLTVVGAAGGAAAFAYASYAPLRILLPIALVASAAISIFLLLPDLGRAWGVGVAAFFVGLVSYSVAGRMRVPPLVVLVPSIIPMLPGLSIYRGLSLLTETNNVTNPSAGMLAMFTAASVAVSLAAGVMLGEYVAQPLKREARRLEGRLAGPRLVGPVRPETRKEIRREEKRREAEERREAKKAAKAALKAELDARKAEQRAAQKQFQRSKRAQERKQREQGERVEDPDRVDSGPIVH